MPRMDIHNVRRRINDATKKGREPSQRDKDALNEWRRENGLQVESRTEPTGEQVQVTPTKVKVPEMNLNVSDDEKDSKFVVENYGIPVGVTNTKPRRVVVVEINPYHKRMDIKALPVTRYGHLIVPNEIRNVSYDDVTFDQNLGITCPRDLVAVALTRKDTFWADAQDYYDTSDDYSFKIAQASVRSKKLYRDPLRANVQGLSRQQTIQRTVNFADAMVDVTDDLQEKLAAFAKGEISDLQLRSAAVAVVDKITVIHARAKRGDYDDRPVNATFENYLSEGLTYEQRPDEEIEDTEVEDDDFNVSTDEESSSVESIDQ
ncbi:hypothetical protein L228DRAFT_239339 [Xylona heveae TC161]|uniref:Uncharacterized protein n=1 Tax=Xylona heveae (strain CBS 132557 / TC161) TaxID=1328760 RepID=A0A165GM94_XYLHT|nr:hypothetical protein L228DRAFT_239339 [Xylona heveae TC161]KZF22364.1 hypothetical protein L228DRAFT_239339 [Xylona heveae TC161]